MLNKKVLNCLHVRKERNNGRKYTEWRRMKSNDKNKINWRIIFAIWNAHFMLCVDQCVCSVCIVLIKWISCKIIFGKYLWTCECQQHMHTNIHPPSPKHLVCACMCACKMWVWFYFCAWYSCSSPALSLSHTMYVCITILPLFLIPFSIVFSRFYLPFSFVFFFSIIIFYSFSGIYMYNVYALVAVTILSFIAAKHAKMSFLPMKYKRKIKSKWFFPLSISHSYINIEHSV